MTGSHLNFTNILKNSRAPPPPDDFILSLWSSRLPARIRRIFAEVDDSDPEKLLKQADLIAKEFGQDYQRTARITTVTDPAPQNSGMNEWLAILNALESDMNRIKAKINALNLDHRPRRRSRRPRSLLLSPNMRGSRTQMPVLLQMEARKRDQLSVKAADDDGLGSHLRHVKRTKISFLVDTGADIAYIPAAKYTGTSTKTRTNCSRTTGRSSQHMVPLRFTSTCP